MDLHLRQLCYIARELDPIVEQLSDILGISACFVDPAVGKYGLQNTLLAVGRNFIEVVAPTRAGTAGGRFLDRRGGDGGYMVITQAPKRELQDAVLARAEAEGVRLAHVIEYPGARIRQLHPGDMGAAFLEVDWDEHGDTQGHWHPAGGTDWQAMVRQDTTVDLTAIELQATDPSALAARWSAVIGTPLVEQQDALVLKLSNADIRFVKDADGRGPGLSAVDLKVRDRAGILQRAQAQGLAVSNNQVSICGVEHRLHEI